jgi:hypothetical protein
MYEPIISFQGATAPSGPGPPHYRGSTTTFRDTTVGRTPLDEWSARWRDLCLTTLTTDRHLYPPVGFEPTIPANEWPQTHALDRADTGIGWDHNIKVNLKNMYNLSFETALVWLWLGLISCLWDYSKGMNNEACSCTFLHTRNDNVL